jgi:hypothetical protein
LTIRSFTLHEVHALSHHVSVVCSANADEAFAYLADPAKLGEWTLGSWGATLRDGGVVEGTSLFDGTSSLVAVMPHPAQMTVDFHVGSDPSRLAFRIAARVVPGESLGRPESSSLVSLDAWRPEGMDDGRWTQLCRSHEAEILILRHRIERLASGLTERDRSDVD